MFGKNFNLMTLLPLGSPSFFTVCSLEQVAAVLQVLHVVEEMAVVPEFALVVSVHGVEGRDLLDLVQPDGPDLGLGGNGHDGLPPAIRFCLYM